ncbi:reverse transcriptase-like protein [Elysia marginata]|uniref:Reverse transcriptase-like protein n=1 Tax=Elysia marginata TaxID=1093978 RepID=A0AAV4H8Y3_9GAST|nr:reverse transcriptase-like protein [Elysia marginata]
MNEDKAELLACSTDRKASPFSIDHMYIDKDKILFSTKAKNFGVYFGTKLSMTHHINHLARIMFSQGGSFLNEDAVKPLVSTFFLFRLDFCNSLLYGLPMDTLKRLQLVQSNAARLILKKKNRKIDYVLPVFKHSYPGSLYKLEQSIR